MLSWKGGTMNKEKGFLAYYNLLIMMIVLASMTTIILSNVSYKNYNSMYLYDAHMYSHMESFAYEMIAKLKDMNIRASTSESKKVMGYTYMIAFIDIIDKINKEYSLSIMSTYKMLYVNGFNLKLVCRIVDDKVIVNNKGFIYGQ